MDQQRTAKDLVATSTVTIEVPRARAWEGLTDPAIIKQYMFGVDVECDWHEGSPLVMRGEWEGKPFEDKGTVMRAEEGRLLEYTHFSVSSGAEDVPENYHTITVTLEGKDDDTTTVSLEQDNNASEEERDISAATWDTMLGRMKDVLES
jgi:uncharacterized protein YndB with AHSA1/START domain